MLQALKGKMNRDKGDEFQDEMKLSWNQVPRCWHRRQDQGKGKANPADHLILTNEINILAEYKATDTDRLSRDLFTESEMKSLRLFERVLPDRNISLVFVKFDTDNVYCIRFERMIEYMQQKQRLYLTLQEFKSEFDNILWLPPTDTGYQLKEVVKCYRSL